VLNASKIRADGVFAMDTRISVASDSLETKRERNNSKNVEKMAIRVEGSSSGEGDGR